MCTNDPDYIDSSDPSVIGQGSYFYLGYAITNEAVARAFIDAYRKHRRFATKPIAMVG